MVCIAVACGSDKKAPPSTSTTPKSKTVPVKRPSPKKTTKVEAPPPVTKKTTSKEDKFTSLINEYRTKGCRCGSTYFPPVRPVRWNNTLYKAALRHSEDMHFNRIFSHTGSDGSSPSERVDAAGYRWMSTAENIAQGQRSIAEVVDSWIRSEGHCKNIMSKNYKDMAVARKGDSWTQVFGSK